MIKQTTWKMHRLSLQLYQVRTRKLEGSMNQMLMDRNQSYVRYQTEKYGFHIVRIIQQALLAKNDLFTLHYNVLFHSS